MLNLNLKKAQLLLMNDLFVKMTAFALNLCLQQPMVAFSYQGFWLAHRPCKCNFFTFIGAFDLKKKNK